MALLAAARTAGLDVAALRARHPRQQEFPFDSVRKRMSAICLVAPSLYLAPSSPVDPASGPDTTEAAQPLRWVTMKGAPESVLSRVTQVQRGTEVITLTTADRATILDDATGLMRRGLRVIACAEKRLPLAESAGPPSQDEAESNLTFVGLIGLADSPPARGRARDRRLQGRRHPPHHGHRDHPDTARAVATAVGLDTLETTAWYARGHSLDARLRHHRTCAPREAPSSSAV